MKKTLKKLLPKQIYNFIRLKPKIVFISESLWLKIKHMNSYAWKQDPDSRGDTCSIILKNAHIIDKGLQSNYRKQGHSFSYVNKLKKDIASLTQTRSEWLSWSLDILSIHKKLNEEGLDAKEYSNFLFESKNSIDFETLFLHIKERRSIRHFLDELPSTDIVEKLFSSVSWAPSSCNRQTVSIFYTNDDNKIIECISVNKGATGLSGKFVFVSVCFDSRSYHLPQESLTGFIDSSLALQNVFLLAHSLKLGATVLNWSHASEDEDNKLRKSLEIPSYCEVVFNCVIGYPKYGAPVPGKKTINELIFRR